MSRQGELRKRWIMAQQAIKCIGVRCELLFRSYGVRVCHSYPNKGIATFPPDTFLCGMCRYANWPYDDSGIECWHPLPAISGTGTLDSKGRLIFGICDVVFEGADCFGYRSRPNLKTPEQWAEANGLTWREVEMIAAVLPEAEEAEREYEEQAAHAYQVFRCLEKPE